MALYSIGYRREGALNPASPPRLVNDPEVALKEWRTMVDEEIDSLDYEKTPSPDSLPEEKLKELRDLAGQVTLDHVKQLTYGDEISLTIFGYAYFVWRV